MEITMANKLNEIKLKISNELFSETELDNFMDTYDYVPMNDDETEDIIKYTNYRSQIWIDVVRDRDNNLLIGKIRYANKERGVLTRSDQFHSFEDLNKVLQYFWDKKQMHHWLCGCLMAALGRRIGDTVSLKWSDLYLRNGKFRDRLITLKEEKTGKIQGVVFNQFAREKVAKYCEIKGIDPLQHYNEKVFNTGARAFGWALKIAVKELGIEYPVSSHSFRKFYGNMMYKLHPQDVDSFKMVQFMFGHSSETITRGYIGAIDEKIDNYNADYSEFLTRSENGTSYEIDHSPVIVLKTVDLRQVIQYAYLSGLKAKRENSIEDAGDIVSTVNHIFTLAEKKRVS